MMLQRADESSGVRHSIGRSIGLVVLGLGVASSTLIRVCGEDHLVLVVSSLLLALCVNFLLVYRRSVDYYLTATSFFILVLIYSLTKLVGVADRYLDVADLGLIALLLASIGYYWFLIDVSSLFKAHTPVAVLVSTFVGIYLGLKYPVRLPLLTIVDALASLTASSSGMSRAESATVATLFFILLYLSPLAIGLDVEALAIFAALYAVRNIALYSNRLQQYKLRVGDLVSFDMVLKPVLVVLT
ncbi:MAG: hypothetical protein QXV72_06580 [Sulfolobales archaeon]